MTIDITLLRDEKGGNPDLVRNSELKRGRDATLVNQVIELDHEWREKVYSMELAKKELNELNRTVGQNRSNKDCDQAGLIDKAKSLKEKVKVLEQATQDAKSQRDLLLKKIGNIVDPSVKQSQDEKDNEVIRVYGVLKQNEEHLCHYDIMALLDIVDLKKGAEVAGHRGYYLKGAGVMLNMALIQYGLSFLRKRGYQDIQPPYVLRRAVMKETAEIGDFSENLYQIATPETKEGHDEKDDLLLIATSEQPISALHRGEFLDPKTLPYKYAGYSTCFRKEAGAHGKDVRGIFRIHQFEKVEQFVITTPEDSTAIHEEMLHIAEEFYQTLGISYRIVSIVSGALNNAASKKYDLEAWFPGQKEYRELVSCSNCLDYQSRDLEIRCGHPKKGDRQKLYVHMLNSTLVASQRALCCLLENYQTTKGVKIPNVLVPYMDGIEFLPYRT